MLLLLLLPPLQIGVAWFPGSHKEGCAACNYTRLLQRRQPYARHIGAARTKCTAAPVRACSCFVWCGCAPNTARAASVAGAGWGAAAELGPSRPVRGLQCHN
jgi:hypothetical protein